MGIESTSAAAARTASTLNTFDLRRRSLTTMTMATRNRHTHAASWQGLVPNHEFSCKSFTMQDETDLNAEHVLYRV